MNEKILIIYATVDGQTLKICEEIKKEILSHEQKVELFSIDEFNGDMTHYDKVIIGSSIRYGLHNKGIIEFINTHKKELDSIKTAFFSVNLVARKPEKRTATTNPYVVKFFKTIDWKPTVVEVFAGMLDYQRYTFFDRMMIRLIMWMTKGPTNSDAKIEYTDWDQVRNFGLRVSKM